MKKHSKKFWVMFWMTSVIFLTGFWFFLQFKKQPAKTVDNALSLIPWLKNKEELKSVAYFAEYVLAKDDREKTFFILFQNDMELRPGGGYIGSFGILKVKDGKVTRIETHDLSNFDGRIPSTVEPPYPMKETLRIDSWKLRDSNWSPDFQVNAEKAEYFYKLGDGRENFDGIVAINTNVLTSFLKITGPVTLADYPGTYDSENAILTLEYQVEKGYEEQGLKKGDRKSVMNELADAVIEKAFKLSVGQKVDLAKMILDDLNKKNIQLYFKREDLEEKSKEVGWAGKVNSAWKKDYLMMVDANLGALKSDYYMKRGFDYTVDLSGEKPRASLKINYTHTGKTKDWMTRDYISYLRVYVPEGSWLDSSRGVGEVRFVDDLGKKYLGSLVKVPLDATHTVELNYFLPQDLELKQYYNILIQKQSGVDEMPGTVTVIDKNGLKKKYDVNLEKDWVLID